jgi:Ca2+-binding RTX toxin-like protein
METAMPSSIEGEDSSWLIEVGTPFKFSLDTVWYTSINSNFRGMYVDEVLAGTLRLNGTAVSNGQFISSGEIDQLTWSPGGKPRGSIDAVSFRAVADIGGGFTIVDDDANTISFEIDYLDVIRGTKRADTVKGTDTRDIIDGRAGNDKLYGGDLSDVFRFYTGYDKDTIMDGRFSKRDDSDQIDLSGLRSVKNYSDLMKNHIEVRLKDVWIDGGDGDILILRRTNIHDLNAHDFIF